MLLATCQSLSEKNYNVNQRALDVLTAYLVFNFSLLKEANPNEPDVKSLETCVLEYVRNLADSIAWSTHLETSPCEKKHKEYGEELSKKSSTESAGRKLILHQAYVIDHFIIYARRQDERMDALEAKLDEARPSSKKRTERRIKTSAALQSTEISRR